MKTPPLPVALTQIVNWRLFLKFPDEVPVSAPAKDLISRLMCDVDDRLGTLGVNEIKVWMDVTLPGHAVRSHLHTRP